MTTKIPLTLTLAALIGFAAPALAAETHAAKHDPQVATTTARPEAQEKTPGAKDAKAKDPAKATAQKPVPQPASK